MASTSPALAGTPAPRRLAWGVPAAGAAAVLLTYLRTLSPSLPTGDSGELITAARVLGIPHPPGYPLYTMLGHMFSLLPIGSAAQRLNILSALLHIGTLVLVYLATWRLLQQDSGRTGGTSSWWRPSVAAAVGALLLAFSTAFWGYSLVAEVFPLNSFFAALLLSLLLEWEQQPWRVRLLWAFALGCGLAASNHHTIVLLAPAFLVLIWSGWRRLGRTSERPRRHTGPTAVGHRRHPPSPALTLGVSALVLLAGLLPYLYLPLAASQDPPLDWGEPRTLENFVQHVTRADYGTFSLAKQDRPGGSRMEQIELFGRYLYHAFTPLGCVLAVIGGWWLAKHRPVQGVALLLALLATGPAFAAYANLNIDNPLWKGVLERFYILPSVPFGVAIGAGAYQTLRWVGGLRMPLGSVRYAAPLAAVALLLLPAGSAKAHLPTVDQSGNTLSRDFGFDMLTPLEPNALYIIRGDVVTFSVDYLQLVEGYRRDVIPVNMIKLTYPWYVQQLRRRYPELKIPFDVYDHGQTASLKSLVEANMGSRAVYAWGPPPREPDFRVSFDVQRVGLADRLLPKGSSPDRWALVRQKPELFTEARYPLRPYPDTTFEYGIASDYGYLAYGAGSALDDDQHQAEATRLYRTAIRLLPDYAPPYKRLGQLLLKQGTETSEVAELWERYLRLIPGDPDATAMRRQVDALRARGR